MTSNHQKTEMILRSWLDDIGFDLQQTARPVQTKLYTELEEWIISQNLQEHQLKYIWKLLPTCISAADKCYPHTSYELKRYIALYTTFLLYVDDKAEQDFEYILPDLQRVSSWACDGLDTLKCDDTIVNLWLKLVTNETRRFYGSYSTGVITKGLVDVMLGNTIEAGFTTNLKLLPVHFGQKFSKFVHDKTGSGEVFAHFIFPEHLATEDEYLSVYAPFIACMLDLVGEVNDILSFFKESVVGTEMSTNIMNRAHISGCDPHDVLEQLCKETLEAMDAVSNAVGEGAIGKLWKDFINGYIMCHICEDRYRLKEIGIAMGLGEVKPEEHGVGAMLGGEP